MPIRIEAPHPLPNSWLVENILGAPKGNPDNLAKEPVTEDIIANINRLPGITAEEIIPHIRRKNSKATWLIGAHAITFFLTRNIGATAARSGWNMDSPQTVYYGGVVLEKNLEENNHPLAQRLRTALDEYVQSGLEPNTPNHRRVLELLTVPTTEIPVHRRDKAMELLREGKIDDAFEKLNTYSPSGHLPVAGITERRGLITMKREAEKATRPIKPSSKGIPIPPQEPITSEENQDNHLKNL